MRISTIAGIGEMPIGTKLEAIRGKITKIFDQKTGSNDHGDWSMQTVGFSDKSGVIDLLLKDREPLHPSWKGKEVLIQAGEYKGKPSGIEIDEYKGKVRIKLTKSADIGDGQETEAPQRRSLQEEERYEQEQARPASQHRQQPTRQAPAQREQPQEPNLADYVKETKIEVMRLASLYTVCHDAAVFQAASVHARHGSAPHPASIGALATTLFIESNRKQIGANLPACDLTKLPAPHFRMIDIIEAYEEQQRELQQPAPAIHPSRSKTQENTSLDEMPEQKW